eukprot:scaffold3342_cov174-Amphora_coffeaeformis.AAC.2
MSTLPSKQEVIVIDSDEGEETKDTSADGATAAAPGNNEDEAVDQVIQILPHHSKEGIRRQLKLCRGNVEEAIDALLRAPVATCKKSPPARKRSKPSTTTAQTTNDATETQQQPQPPTKRVLFERSLPSPAINADESHDNNAALSPAWHTCYQRALPTGRFVDSDFGPVLSSLDGRRHGNESNKNTAAIAAATIECRCGLPAAARQVQSDGPNYGRFYLTCGQVLRQKRRAAVAVIKADSPSARASPSASPRKQPCNFFQWDPHGALGGGAGYASSQSRFGYISWHAFDDTTTRSCLYKHSIGPDQVQQGAIGNCWFLSALAVVAEKPYLVKRMLPHTKLNAVGCYQVNLCLDGVWQAVIVDSFLPVIHRDASKKTNRPREGVPLQNGTVAVPAFCATPQGQLWGALVEKAYAKAHGSYAQLSGGFIAEGLADLTGAPCETIIFDLVERELLWGRLLSFAQADFAMGVATSGRKAQQGLVSCHAYSVLDVIQLDNIVVGEQKKVTDFFGSKGSSNSSSLSPQITSVRLVRIRNPWGVREWKGDWSAKSTQWTYKLRKLLPASWRQGDGTFFMSFEDMLQNFHHMDVCKTHMGWHHTSKPGTWSRTTDPLRSSKQFYRLVLSEATHAFISLIQPKKRANTETTYWYTDPSMVILRRRVGSSTWDDVAKCGLSGIQRITSFEVFLEPSKYDYICMPFSCYAQSDNTPFRLVVYSAKAVQIQSFPNHVAKDAMPNVLEGIHNHLFKVEHKLIYPLSRRAVLVCSQTSHGCYFIGLNATQHCISLRLTVDCPAGILCVYGDANSPSHDLAPGSQKILLVLSGTGKSSSTATQCHFRYASAVEKCHSTATVAANRHVDAASNLHLGGTLSLTMAGEVFADSVAGDLTDEGRRGDDRLDTYSWIPEIGSSIV